MLNTEFVFRYSQFFAGYKSFFGNKWPGLAQDYQARPSEHFWPIFKPAFILVMFCKRYGYSISTN